MRCWYRLHISAGWRKASQAVVPRPAWISATGVQKNRYHPAVDSQGTCEKHLGSDTFDGASPTAPLSSSIPGRNFRPSPFSKRQVQHQYTSGEHVRTRETRAVCSSAVEKLCMSSNLRFICTRVRGQRGARHCLIPFAGARYSPADVIDNLGCYTKMHYNNGRP